MPDVLRRIDGLALGAQHDLVDEAFVVGVADLREDAVELRRAQLGAARERDVERLQELAQRFLLGE